MYADDKFTDNICERIFPNPRIDCASIRGIIKTPINTARNQVRICAENPEYRKTLKSFSVLIGNRSHIPEKKTSEVATAKTLHQTTQMPDIRLLTKNDAINCGS